MDTYISRCKEKYELQEEVNEEINYKTFNEYGMFRL